MSNIHLNQKKKRKKKKRGGNVKRATFRRKGKKKKKVKIAMYGQNLCASAQGHFCPLCSPIFSFQFSLHFGEKIFWWA